VVGLLLFFEVAAVVVAYCGGRLFHVEGYSWTERPAMITYLHRHLPFTKAQSFQTSNTWDRYRTTNIFRLRVKEGVAILIALPVTAATMAFVCL
jgi:hypothetical protein